MLFEISVVVLVLVFTVVLVFLYLKDYEKSGLLIAKAGSRIPMEREKFIPLLRYAMQKKLAGAVGAADPLSENGKLFEQLMSLFDVIVSLENKDLIQEMIQDYELFDPACARLQPTDVATPAQRRVSEQRFLRNFFTMMEKANFKVLSRRELEFAEAEEYTLRIPVTCEWEKIDREMLPAFFASEFGQKFKNVEAPEMVDQLIIWRRGVGVDRTTGLLMNEKIDTVLQRGFDFFASKITRMSWWIKLSGVPPPPPPIVNDVVHVNEEMIERKSLTNMPLSLAFFTKPTTIQEPTFKEVVALFRLRPPAATTTAIVPPLTAPNVVTAAAAPPAAGAPLATMPKLETNDGVAIHIKTFRDIPLADLDIIFPAQKITFTMTDFVRLGLSAVVGFFFALVAFQSVFSGDGIGLSLLTACAGFIGYALRTYWAIQWSVDTYRVVLGETLYQKSCDTHRGVLLFLHEALEAQELKETLLSYSLALQRGAPISEAELDKAAEMFISAETKQVPGVTPSVDFEVDDAVDKLVRFGIADVKGERGSRIIEAHSLASAVRHAQTYVDSLVADAGGRRHARQHRKRTSGADDDEESATTTERHRRKHTTTTNDDDASTTERHRHRHHVKKESE